MAPPQEGCIQGWRHHGNKGQWGGALGSLYILFSLHILSRRSQNLTGSQMFPCHNLTQLSLTGQILSTLSKIILDFFSPMCLTGTNATKSKTATELMQWIKRYLFNPKISKNCLFDINSTSQPIDRTFYFSTESFPLCPTMTYVTVQNGKAIWPELPVREGRMLVFLPQGCSVLNYVGCCEKESLSSKKCPLDASFVSPCHICAVSAQ